eukprot:1144554-Pelagomonas_calceolata.AAC.4
MPANAWQLTQTSPIWQSSEVHAAFAALRKGREVHACAWRMMHTSHCIGGKAARCVHVLSMPVLGEVRACA